LFATTLCRCSCRISQGGAKMSVTVNRSAIDDAFKKPSNWGRVPSWTSAASLELRCRSKSRLRALSTRRLSENGSEKQFAATRPTLRIEEDGGNLPYPRRRSPPLRYSETGSPPPNQIITKS
jgi:hypothetical protein